MFILLAKKCLLVPVLKGLWLVLPIMYFYLFENFFPFFSIFLYTDQLTLFWMGLTFKVILTMDSDVEYEIDYGSASTISVSLSYSANLVVFHDYFLKFGSSGRKYQNSVQIIDCIAFHFGF